MLDNLFTTIKIGAVTIATISASFLGYVPTQAPTLGATYQTPDVKAVFVTTLASKITSSATSMTLTSATDKDGNTLASSTYGFVIDEGTSVEEFVLADCVGTTCTNMTRGLSVYTATTSLSSLKFEHRRGASVKITTAPSLVFIINAFKGRQNIENPLRYESSISTSTLSSNGQNLASVAYANSLSFGAVAAANETTTGFVELATQTEAASSTSTGGTGSRLALGANLATSTYNSATAGLRVVVTKNNGKIDDNFVSTTTFGINLTAGDGFTGSSTLSTNTTLTQDTYYTNLTIQAGVTLNTNGYRLFANNLTNNGTISNNGGAGGAGSLPTGGTAGATTTSTSTLPGGIGGKRGGDGSGSAAPSNGTDGVNSTYNINSSVGSAGGGGGSGSGGAGSSGGAGGTNTLTVGTPRDLVSSYYLFTFASSTGVQRFNISSGAGSGGGGRGRADATDQGGGGGGSGASGGVVFIWVGNLTNNGTISANGGAGGNGGNGGPSAGTGGGGGGAGGNGGAVYIVYKKITTQGTITASGGTGGTGGTGTTSSGNNGAAGTTGIVSLIPL